MMSRVSTSTSFKYRFGFSGFGMRERESEKKREMDGDLHTQKFTYSSVTVGVGGYSEKLYFGVMWGGEEGEKKNIHLAISSPAIGTHKPSNRLRGEDNTNVASDFYGKLVNAIYWGR